MRTYLTIATALLFVGLGSFSCRSRDAWPEPQACGQTTFSARATGLDGYSCRSAEGLVNKRVETASATNASQDSKGALTAKQLLSPTP